MTSRLVRLCLAGLFAASTLSLRAQPPALPAPVAADDPLIDQVKLPNADINLILDSLKIYTGRIIIVSGQLPPPGVNGYNLMIETPMRKSEIVRAIETVLAVNGIGVSPIGDRYLLVNNLQTIRGSAPEMITGSAFDLPPSGKIALKVFQLDFLRLQEVQGIIQPILTPGVQILPVASANAMVITDSVYNLQRVQKLLAELDRPKIDDLKPKAYSLKFTKASELVQKLNGILGGQQRQQLGLATNFQYDDRANQIILIADPRQYPLFDELIAMYDVESAPNTRNVVIQLKHATTKGEFSIIPVLEKVITGQTTAAQRSNSSRPGQQRPGNPIQPTVPGAPPVPGAPNILANPPIAAATEGFGAGSAEFSSLITVAPDDRSNAIVV
ncbi:MAG: secretin N-terminal domain-containing protein, partial [Opitutaceae bacterium]